MRTAFKRDPGARRPDPGQPTTFCIDCGRLNPTELRCGCYYHHNACDARVDADQEAAQQAKAPR